MKIVLLTEGVVTGFATGGVVGVEVADDSPVGLGWRYVNEHFLPAPPSASYDWDGEQWVLNPEKAAVELARQRADVALKINTWRDAQEALSIVFTHAGHDWDGGLKVRSRLQATVALPTLPAGFFWTNADNIDVLQTTVSLAELNAAHEAALVARGWQIHQRQREMKTQIAVLEGDALNAYQIGWPT